MRKPSKNRLETETRNTTKQQFQRVWLLAWLVGWLVGWLLGWFHWPEQHHSAQPEAAGLLGDRDAEALRAQTPRGGDAELGQRCGFGTRRTRPGGRNGESFFECVFLECFFFWLVVVLVSFKRVLEFFFLCDFDFVLLALLRTLEGI